MGGRKKEGRGGRLWKKHKGKKIGKDSDTMGGKVHKKR